MEEAAVAQAPRTVFKAVTMSLGNCCIDANDKYIDARQLQGGPPVVVSGGEVSLVIEVFKPVDSCGVESRGGVVLFTVPKSISAKFIAIPPMISRPPKCQTIGPSSADTRPGAIVSGGSARADWPLVK
jgi:hypothetical protein